MADMMDPTACCKPGEYDPNKTPAQATADRIRMIKMSTGGHCSHFTPEEQMQAELDENGGMQETQS